MAKPSVRTALIPAAGLGSRLLPCTKSQPKEMLAVGRRPTIQHVVEECIGSGVVNLCIVTGWQKRAIEDHFDLSHGGARLLRGEMPEMGVLLNGNLNRHLFYIRQAEQRGLGDAVLHGEQFIGDEPFLVALGDTICYSPAEPGLVKRLISAHAESDAFATIAVEPVAPADVAKYGIVAPAGEVRWDQPTQLLDIIEKPAPDEAPSHYAVASRYVFDPLIFDALQRTTPGRNGEIQLTDAIRTLIREGHPCQVVALAPGEKRYDIGNFGSYYRAFIEMALRDPAEGPALREHLQALLAEAP